MKILRAEIMIGGIGLPKLTLCQRHVARYTTRKMLTPPFIDGMMLAIMRNTHALASIAVSDFLTAMLHRPGL
nr:hypothetical protein [Cronobacter turicensis]